MNQGLAAYSYNWLVSTFARCGNQPVAFCLLNIKNVNDGWMDGWIRPFGQNELGRHCGASYFLHSIFNWRQREHDIIINNPNRYRRQSWITASWNLNRWESNFSSDRNDWWAARSQSHDTQHNSLNTLSDPVRQQNNKGLYRTPTFTI